MYPHHLAGAPDFSQGQQYSQTQQFKLKNKFSHVSIAYMIKERQTNLRQQQREQQQQNDTNAAAAAQQQIQQ